MHSHILMGIVLLFHIGVECLFILLCFSSHSFTLSDYPFSIPLSFVSEKRYTSVGLYINKVYYINKLSTYWIPTGEEHPDVVSLPRVPLLQIIRGFI